MSTLLSARISAITEAMNWLRRFEKSRCDSSAPRRDQTEDGNQAKGSDSKGESYLDKRKRGNRTQRFHI